MALKLSKATRSGGTVEYWRISPMMSVDVVAQTLAASVWPYINATARQAGKPPMSHSELDPTETPMQASMSGAGVITALQTGDPRAALYGVLKALPFFSGSEDV